MKVEVKKLPESQLELNIEVTPQEIGAFLNKAAAKISRGMKIAGFRPGRAPRPIIENRVGSLQLWEEAAREGLPYFLAQVIRKYKIEALGRPRVSIVKLAPGNPFVFRTEMAVVPEVVLGDYKEVKVKRPKVRKPTSQDVTNLIKRLQKMRAKFTKVEREARLGDRVEIDFQAYLKNNLIEGGKSKNHPLIVGESEFVPGFEENLVGLKAGEEKEFSLKFPRDYFKKNLAGRLIRFKVKMKTVQKCELPPINDEFAKNLGPGFASLADLRKKFKDNLQKEAEISTEERYELEVLNKVTSRARMEIPAVLLEYEKERMMRELEEDIVRQGGNFENYLTSIKKTREDLKQGWEREARKRIKTSLVLRKIAQKEKIKVREQDVATKINEISKTYPNLPEVKKYFSSETYRDYIRGVLRNRKVVKMLCRN